MSEKIPIRNIYYLLSYAWDCLEELEEIGVEKEGYKTPEDLYARILCRGTNQLIRRGLYRTYNEKSEDVRGIKGKLDVSVSVKRNLFTSGRAHCQFDELSFENPYNLIVYSTLHFLLRSKNISNNSKKEIDKTLKRMPYLPQKELQASDFSSMTYNRLNSSYRLLINICELVYHAFGVSEEVGDLSFSGFLRKKRDLNKLFEEFVYRFYKKKAKDKYQTSRPHIPWQAVPQDDESASKLPIMRTDIHLTSPEKVITIDTKFYGKTFSEYKSKESIHSGNLYQIMAYLENLNQKDQLENISRKHEGVLLYPVVNQDVDLNYEIWGYDVKIRTVDLSKDWSVIDQDLLSIVS